MPATYNGIGTTYYGKQNLQARTGICEVCKSYGELTSYETRLWFVVFYVPTIPLGKKQILDYCASCTRHRAVPMGEWGRVTGDAVAEARENAEKKPDDPEAAMEYHGALVAFQRGEEAEAYGQTLAAKFPNHAGVQFHLGAWHEQRGKPEAADKCFQRALEIEPDNRAAARAVAVGCIGRGELERARELLSFMETPGPDQDAGVLVMLADAYQAALNHESALALYAIALDGAPSLARDKKLRQRVQKSENGVGRPGSVLREPPKTAGRLWYWAAGAAAVVGLAIFINNYAASRQTLHVVNRLPGPVTVTIDGQDESLTVGEKAVEEIPISEGDHQAVIRTAEGEESTVDFEIRNSLWGRFFGNRVFILNPKGAADLEWQEAVYTAVPDPLAEYPYKIYFGKEFLALDDIDYVFEEFPEQIKIPGKDSSVTKTGVNVLDVPTVEVMLRLSHEAGHTEMLSYAEHRLTLDPNANTLLQFYSVLSTGTGESKRCRAFLEKRLSEEPVLIEWHRMYQETAENAGDEEAMISRYDQLLDESPNNSALLYLRGRLAPLATAAIGYFDRSIKADPENPYPHFAKGYYLDSIGAFTEAKSLVDKACQLEPGHAHMTRLLLDIRLALGEYEALEGELRSALKEAEKEDGFDLAAHRDLLRVLVADGRAAEAESVSAALEAASGAGPQQDPGKAAAARASRRSLQYLTGDLKAWRETVPPPSAPGLPSGYPELLLSLAWRRKGNDLKAEHWRQEAVEKLASRTLDERQIADLLRKGDSVGLAEVDETMGPRTLKAIVLVALADTSTDSRRKLIEKAEKLNVLGYFPYWFLKRTIDAMRQSS
ncbi:MAG: tetratricopeptide repeat protein [Planctomycetota bacterium]|jgi:tetratricopeptide (TPR) repeat protein